MTNDSGPSGQPPSQVTPTIRCPCDGRHVKPAFEYATRPPGETNFVIGGAEYERYFDCCTTCGHWFGRHAMSLGDLYSGAYVETTYGENLKATFERIIALPRDSSDNFGRSQRIDDFASKFLADYQRSLLDIGAGTGVFPYTMNNLGWSCTALDPDSRACEHLKERVGVAVIYGDLNSIERESIGTFDLVTLNKVIEHVDDPVSMLTSAGQLLSRNSLLYVEVPDGSAAARLGQQREEFYVEHLHAFSVASLALSIERAGLSCISLDRLVEPSGKCTLFAFATNREQRPE